MWDIKSKISPERSPELKKRLKDSLPVIIIGISVAIFFVDIITPLWYAVWIFYFIPVLLTSWLPSQRKYLFYLSLVFPVLIIVGYFIPPIFNFTPNAVTRAVINRTTGTLTLWLTALLLVHRRNAVDKLRQAHEQLENKVRERTAELRATNEQLEKEIKERMAAEKKIARHSVTLEEKVKDRTKKLLNAERLKSRFIADASHEFRTPLAIIKSYLDLALGKKSKKVTDPHHTLREINKEVGHISQIFTDLTLLARSDSNFHYTLNPVTFSLQKLIANLIKKHSVLAKNKNIAITRKFSSQLNYRGDKEKLEKLFTNLLMNAIQYGREGGWINVSLLEDDQWVAIEIEDNGIGIPKEDVPHIFERFYRVEKMRTRNAGGVGLGLAICRWIAEAHGGTVRVSSVYNQGSVFTVKLPT